MGSTECCLSTISTKELYLNKIIRTIGIKRLLSVAFLVSTYLVIWERRLLAPLCACITVLEIDIDI